MAAAWQQHHHMANRPMYSCTTASAVTPVPSNSYHSIWRRPSCLPLRAAPILAGLGLSGAPGCIDQHQLYLLPTSETGHCSNAILLAVAMTRSAVGPAAACAGLELAPPSCSGSSGKSLVSSG